MFPLVAVDDVAGDADWDWETVNELLREVGHQLAGLRSFIRRVRTDNAAVYREIVQTARHINRANIATGAIQCQDDDENDEDDNDNEDDDFQEEPVPSLSPPVLRQLTDSGDDKSNKRSLSGTVGE